MTSTNPGCRESKESTMANVIGRSIVIEGEITGDEDLVIQGTVKG